MQRTQEVAANSIGVGQKLHSPLVTGDGVGGPSQVFHGIAEIVVRFAEVLTQLQGTPDACRGFFEVAECPKGRAEAVVCIGIVGLQPYSPSQGRHRLGRPALIQKHDTEIVVRLGIIHVEHDAPLIARERLSKIALGLIGRAEAVVELCLGAIQF